MPLKNDDDDDEIKVFVLHDKSDLVVTNFVKIVPTFIWGTINFHAKTMTIFNI